MTQPRLPTCRPPNRRSANAILLLTTAILALAATAAPDSVRADSESATDIQLAQAETGRTVALDIPARPLDTALTALADQAGLRLLFEAGDVPDRQAPALRGEYTPREALRRLLASTGLDYRFSNANTVTLVQAGDGSTELGAIMVEGRAETGTGPVEGFRANRSVTATNVDAPLIETPAMVNVLTRDFLDAIQPRRFEDALAYVPGAGQEITFGNSDPVFNLRGFSTTGREGGIVVDGYQLNRRSYIPDLSLYERVDILKGTSGVLYGTARPGGIVNYIRKRPRFDRSFSRVEASVGSFDTARASFDTTGQVNEKLAYRFTATRQDANQTIHGDNDSSVPDDRTILNAGLTWLTPSEGEVRFNYEHYFIDQVFDPGIQFINGDWTFNREPLTNPDQFSEREFDIFRTEYEQPIAKHWSTLVGLKYDTGDTRRFLDAAVTGALDGSPVDRFTDRTVEDYEQLEGRAEITGQFSTGMGVKHDLTAGINRFETDLDRGRNTAFAAQAIDPFDPDFSNPPALATPSPNDPSEAQEFEQTRVFAQDYISIGERLTLIGGVAYTDFDQKDGPAENSDSETDYTVGAIYNANAWINPYLSYSTSTQPQLGELEGGSTLPPREAEQLEIGLKREWFGGRLATTVSAFEIEQTDKAETGPVDPDSFRLSGDERVRGVELEAKGNVSRNIDLLAGYSYLDAEFSKSADPDLEGNTLPNIPEQKVSVFAVYEGLAGVDGLSGGLSIVHVGDRKAGNDNIVDLSTFTRGDLYLSYQRNDWMLDLTVENITDKDYVAGTRPGFPSPNGTFQAAQGTLRFVTLTARHEF